MTKSAIQAYEVKKIAGTEMPQRLMYTALYMNKHGDFINDIEQEKDVQENAFAEDTCGNLLTSHFRHTSQTHPSWGSFSSLEHPYLSLYIRAAHSTLHELCTERRDITFSLQPLYEAAENTRLCVKEKDYPLEKLFHSRTPGNYPDYTGNRHPWSQEDEQNQLASAYSSAIDYDCQREAGASSVQAQQLLTMCMLQNVTASGSLRAWLRLLDSCSRPNKSYETKSLTDLIADHVASWVPEVYAWWSNSQRSKTELRV